MCRGAPPLAIEAAIFAGHRNKIEYNFTEVNIGYRYPYVMKDSSSTV